MTDPHSGSFSIKHSRMKRPRRPRVSGKSAAWFLTGFAAGRWLGRRTHMELQTVQASRQIVNHVSEAIISADQSNTIVMANPAAAALFGTSVERMVGSPLRHYIEGPAEDAGAAEPVDYFRAGSGRAGRRAPDYTVTGVRNDGGRFPLEGSI